MPLCRKGPPSSRQALKKAVQQALHQGFLSKGLHEVCKAVEGQKAKVVVLADNCDNKDIVNLVKALCKEQKVPILAIPEAQTLAEWIGIQHNLKKPRKCSVLAIREFPDDISEEEVKFIMSQL